MNPPVGVSNVKQYCKSQTTKIGRPPFPLLREHTTIMSGVYDDHLKVVGNTLCMDMSVPESPDDIRASLSNRFEHVSFLQLMNGSLDIRVAEALVECLPRLTEVMLYDMDLIGNALDPFCRLARVQLITLDGPAESDCDHAMLRYCIAANTADAAVPPHTLRATRYKWDVSTAPVMTEFLASREYTKVTLDLDNTFEDANGIVYDDETLGYTEESA